MSAASSTLTVGGETYEIYRLDADVGHLPFTLRILLENALRTGTEADVHAVTGWDAAAEPSRELSFTPARVLDREAEGGVEHVLLGLEVVVDDPGARSGSRRDVGMRTRRYPTSVISSHVAFSTSSRRSASTLGRGLIERSPTCEGPLIIDWRVSLQVACSHV